MIVSLSVAATENNVIGKDGAMPWDLPAELQNFRAITSGKPIIMGRKTYESIGYPLPKRHNIVITRNAALRIPGVDVVTTLQDALALAEKDGLDEAFVIGGEQIYRMALPYADRVYLSRIHTTVEGGDAFFSGFNEEEWELVHRVRREADAENAHAFTINIYERKK